MKRKGRPPLSEEIVKAVKSPTITDIAWMAGFYEGEGHINFTGKSPNMMIGQKDVEKLLWAKDRFGGKIYEYPRNGQPFYTLRISNIRAIGFCLTVFSFLSQKRKEEIRKILKVSQIMADDSGELEIDSGEAGQGGEAERLLNLLGLARTNAGGGNGV